MRNHIYQARANATRVPAGQSREPALLLKEIAEKMDVPLRRLCGFMSQDGPRPVLFAGRAKTPHYRLSEFQSWWAELKRTGGAV